MSLCLHSITTKPWSLEQCAQYYPAAGVQGITVWRQHLEGLNIAAEGQRLREAGLEIVSLCRGGFFTSTIPSQRQLAIDDNLRAIDEAAALGAPLIVLVCGASPEQSLSESRWQIQQGIEAVLPHAQACGIKLAIEPLHPLYAADRSAINTITQAREMCERINVPQVGVAVDVYHVWWDPYLEQEIQKIAEQKRLFAYHICDWKTQQSDPLNDRGLMGEGCINLKEIGQWIHHAGFKGPQEVEIFSHQFWSMDQHQFLQKIVHAYHNLQLA